MGDRALGDSRCATTAIGPRQCQLRGRRHPRQRQLRQEWQEPPRYLGRRRQWDSWQQSWKERRQHSLLPLPSFFLRVCFLLFVNMFTIFKDFSDLKRARVKRRKCVYKHGAPRWQLFNHLLDFFWKSFFQTVVNTCHFEQLQELLEMRRRLGINV